MAPPIIYDRIEILRQIAQYQAQYGTSPNRQELAKALGAPHTSSLNWALKTLRRTGYIEIREQQARNLGVSELGMRSIAAGKLLPKDDPPGLA